MSHTPQQIADLARAALAAPKCCCAHLQIGTDGEPYEPHCAFCSSWAAYAEACTPATVLALCERLRVCDNAIQEINEAAGMDGETGVMTTPLTPQAEEARP